MKAIIRGTLLGTVTIKPDDMQSNLIASYIPPKFIVDKKNLRDNLRVDITVKVFHVAQLTGRLPAAIKDVKDIIVMELKYNEYGSPVLSEPLLPKFVEGDRLVVDLLLPLFFRLRRIVVVKLKGNAKPGGK